MALIGSINVALAADTTKFDSDLAKAATALSRLSGALRKTAGDATSVGSLESTGGRISGAFGGIGRSAVQLGAAFLGLRAVAGVGSFFKDGVKGASDLNETLNKTTAILGDTATPAVVKFADEMAAKFGLAKRETLDAAAGFGGLAKGIGGLKGDALAKFTTDTTKLAADLSSFANMDMKDATRALLIGLSGEQSDELKRLGVIVNETTVKEFALAHGISKAGEALSEQQKFAARSGLINEKLADAQNDLERTADAPANVFRKAVGGMENFATSVGQVVLPAIATVVGGFTDMLGGITAGFESNKATVQGWGQTLKGWADSVAFTVRNAGAIWQLLVVDIAEPLANGLAVLQAFGQNVVRIGGWLGENWVNLLRDSFNASLKLFENFSKNGAAFGEALVGFLKNPAGGFNVEWTPLLDGFKATTEKLPEMARPAWVSMQADRDRILGQIGKSEADRAKALTATPGAPPQVTEAVRTVELFSARAFPKSITKPEDAMKALGAMSAGLVGLTGGLGGAGAGVLSGAITTGALNGMAAQFAGGGPVQLAGAAELGSKDAYKTLAQFGAQGMRGGGDPVKDTAKTVKDSLTEHKKTNATLAQIAAKSGGLAAYTF